MSRAKTKAGLGDVDLDLDFEEDADLDDTALLAPLAAKAVEPELAPVRSGIQLVQSEKQVHLPLTYDQQVRERLLAEAESKECTKGEIVVIALDKVLAELEREHNNGSPFPRVTRLKTGVNPPDLPNRDRVRARDGFWVPRSVKERVRNTVGALQRQGYRMTVGYLVEQALESHLSA